MRNPEHETNGTRTERRGWLRGVLGGAAAGLVVLAGSSAALGSVWNVGPRAELTERRERAIWGGDEGDSITILPPITPPTGEETGEGEDGEDPGNVRGHSDVPDLPDGDGEGGGGSGDASASSFGGWQPGRESEGSTDDPTGVTDGMWTGDAGPLDGLGAPLAGVGAGSGVTGPDVGSPAGVGSARVAAAPGPGPAVLGLLGAAGLMRRRRR